MLTHPLIKLYEFIRKRQTLVGKTAPQRTMLQGGYKLMKGII